MHMRLPWVITTSLIALLWAPAQAQPRKCTAPDGKVTYSDVACPDRTASERPVETSGNTLDGSALREQAQKDRAAATQAEATARERAAFAEGIRLQAQAQAAADAKQEARNAQSDTAALSRCLHNVERTEAFPKDKARQMALCHGADVMPEPSVVVLRPSVRTMGPPRMTTCSGNQCSDDMGQRYFKQQGTGLVREDGKHCQIAAGNTVRCP